MSNKYKYYRQLDYMDQGPTCIRMIASYYGKEFSIKYIRANSPSINQGSNLSNLSNAAENIGFRTLSLKLNYSQLIEEVTLPCILHWNQKDFVVLYDIKNSYRYKGENKEKFIIGDPGNGLLNIDMPTLKKCWLNSNNNIGIALLLEPTNEFYNKQEAKIPILKKFKFFAIRFNYLKNSLFKYLRR